MGALDRDYKVYHACNMCVMCIGQKNPKKGEKIGARAIQKGHSARSIDPLTPAYICTDYSMPTNGIEMGGVGNWYRYRCIN